MTHTSNNEPHQAANTVSALQQRRAEDEDEATTSMHRAVATHNEEIWQRRTRHQAGAQIKELGNDHPTSRWRQKNRTATP